MLHVKEFLALCIESWVRETPEDGCEMLQPKHVVFKVR